jgi:hypothetical protein
MKIYRETPGVVKIGQSGNQAIRIAGKYKCYASAPQCLRYTTFYYVACFVNLFALRKIFREVFCEYLYFYHYYYYHHHHHQRYYYY